VVPVFGVLGFFSFYLWFFLRVCSIVASSFLPIIDALGQLPDLILCLCFFLQVIAWSCWRALVVVSMLMPYGILLGSWHLSSLWNLNMGDKVIGVCR
jgi:hypothetical protein